nr:hypothetical protein [Janthinobacterium sp.]
MEYREEGGRYVTLEGTFGSGQLHGFGRKYVDNVLTCEGVWHQGVPDDAIPTETEQHLELVMDQPWFDSVAGSAAVYRGLWCNDQPHGHGVAIYDERETDMASYERCFDAGRFQGHGRLVYATGDVYTGDFHNSHRHGVGTYQWRDGRCYAGDWVANARNGRGVYTYLSGDRYEGDFLGGHRSGLGTFVFVSTGASYTGEWTQGRYHGAGRTVDEAGCAYTGEFQCGERHGHGQEYNATGLVTFDGQWVHDVKQDGSKQAIAATESAAAKKNTMDAGETTLQHQKAPPTSPPSKPPTPLSSARSLSPPPGVLKQ